jgi:hypothetical protein
VQAVELTNVGIHLTGWAPGLRTSNITDAMAPALVTRPSGSEPEPI